MKRVLLVCSTLAAMFLCFTAHAFTVSYDQVTTGIQKGAANESSIKIKDGKMKMESGTSQGKIIVIMDGTVGYQYIPSQSKAYKMTIKGPTNIKDLSDYRGYLSTLDAKVAGSESIGDYDCDIYEFTDPRENVRARAWVWRAKNFPVKYELDIHSGTVTTLMKNIKINESIDDSEFMVPAGVEVVDMRYMSGQGKKNTGQE